MYGGENEIEVNFENPSAYDRLMAKEITFEEFYQIKNRDDYTIAIQKKINELGLN